MTRWIDALRKGKKAMLNQRGESLVESVVSILVFSIFMLAVTTTILSSLRMTGIATAAAKEQQDAYNQARLAPQNQTKGNLTLRMEGSTVSIPVLVHRDGDFPQSFCPEVAVSP